MNYNLTLPPRHLVMEGAVEEARLSYAGEGIPPAVYIYAHAAGTMSDLAARMLSVTYYGEDVDPGDTGDSEWVRRWDRSRVIRKWLELARVGWAANHRLG
jgi:hypothetical protein